MLFNSLHFLIFFPIVTILYYLLPHSKRWLLLLIASCYFYMVFKPIYILILFFTIVIDYIAGIYIDKHQGQKRKMFLVMSLIANIGVLAFFKYFNFITFNINLLSGPLGFQQFSFLDIVLPIGLSFHTFQAMSYTIEIYRGNFKPERHFGIYALYVMYYPQLVAGPIERPQNILPQLHEKHELKYTNITSGLKMMLYGLFKKVVIADNLAVIVDNCYNNYSHLHGPPLMLCFVFFSIQIYCDFSGYSDIAIGASRVMGIELMRNFNFPYFSQSIDEFWRKWHISLSSWFRDYLYIPLGGNKVSKLRRSVNVMIVFTVSGLWHGANFTFLFWGFIHGFFRVTEEQVKKLKITLTNFAHDTLAYRAANVTKQIVMTVFTFTVVTFAWVFFRAPSITVAYEIIQRSLMPHAKFSMALLSGKTYVMPIVVLFMVFEFFIKDKGFVHYLDPKPVYYRLGVLSALMIGILYFGLLNNSSFIYFQF